MQDVIFVAIGTEQPSKKEKCLYNHSFAEGHGNIQAVKTHIDRKRIHIIQSCP